jgi:hypothetical protein
MAGGRGLNPEEKTTSFNRSGLQVGWLQKAANPQKSRRAEMEYSIEHLPKKNIVSLHVSGEIDDSELLIKAAHEMIALASTHNYDKFLIDYTHAKVKLEIIDIYESATIMVDIGFKRTDRIASVIPEAWESIKFFVTVAHNRGWFNIRLFSDSESAFQWLEEED